ncbi:MAG: hypothetical protein HQ543_11610 [Bacteroidetes bacterium]|nr:hypothetical protein [Bacteroidota bacterium]
MKTLFFIGFVILFPLTLLSQEADTSIVSQEADTSMAKYRKDALKVFLDCPFCDDDYIRREISFVNYVRDRKVADVHIMVTSQRTGSGGREYMMHFLGQNGYTRFSDTLAYVSKTDNTEDETRSGQVETMKMGLMPFVSKTPLSKFIKIDYKPPVKEEVVEDKWNQWVFNTRLSGFLNGQKSYNYDRISGSFSASRVTPEWKIDFDLNYRVSNDEFDTGDTIFTSSIKSKSFDGLIVKSLGEHWSVGGRFDLLSFTYRNYKLRGLVYPGIEYNVFPYSESTRKQLLILYSLGYSYNSYQDSTIYNKIEENLFGHSLSVAMEFTQKWGSIYTSIDWNNYFHDWSKNNLSSVVSLSIRVAKGLQIGIGGGASIIHDQLSLVKGGASTEEILLQRKELETSYSYFTQFSVSYTFGSIYNNVVNPRFGGGGGMMFFY